MLGLAKRLKARILQASTSEVYGDPAIHPQVESYWGNVNPIGAGPRSCYDEGKRCAETLFFDYHRQHALEIKVARILQHVWPAYAPRGRSGCIEFYRSVHKGEPITLYGDGRQTRSFCYVDDLIDGLIRLMESPADLVGPINLGNPSEFSMRELADLVVAETGSTSGVDMKPLPQDDPKQRRPNISLATDRLGWTPRISLREGLKPTIEYFRSILA